MTTNLAELLDRREVCRFFGGTRPLNAANALPWHPQGPVSRTCKSRAWLFALASF